MRPIMMENLGGQASSASAIWEVSLALMELRDALSQLSLALRDWQYEADFEQRKIVEETVRQLLAKVGSAHGPLPH